ncbi:uncharacterized protein [Narcine bancroftii]|uniref:uncharacterized protein n=1 Tax=Narcine bancroftii TaxID=1343680 RepID=UPI003830FF9A
MEELSGLCSIHGKKWALQRTVLRMILEASEQGHRVCCDPWRLSVQLLLKTSRTDGQSSIRISLMKYRMMSTCNLSSQFSSFSKHLGLLSPNKRRGPEATRGVGRQSTWPDLARPHRPICALTAELLVARHMPESCLNKDRGIYSCSHGNRQVTSPEFEPFNRRNVDAQARVPKNSAPQTMAYLTLIETAQWCPPPHFVGHLTIVIPFTIPTDMSVLSFIHHQGEAKHEREQQPTLHIHPGQPYT